MKETNKYLIKNCKLADFDTLLTKPSEILIEGDKISKIADKVEPALCEGATIIDAKGMVAMPSFVDAHTHMAQTFLKGPMDDYPITTWLVRMFTIVGMMDDETFYYSNLLGCLQSLRCGTTTINEMFTDYKGVDAGLQAFCDSGIRATVGTSTTNIAENPKTPVLSIEECLERSETVYKKAHGRNNGLIRASVAPAGLPACTKELFQALKAFADERDLVFHTHLAEGKKETNDVMRMYGLRGEAEALYEFGILGPKTLLAHSIWLNDFELDLIKQCNANPVHCPNTNMKIADGIPPIADMIAKGINVAMGCDGEASSSTRDMIREGRAGSYLQKAHKLDATVLDAGTVFKMMTQNGARALGYTNLGVLKEGYQADLILVNTENDLTLVNPDYKISNILYAGDGHAVDTVFCNGTLQVRGGKLVHFDEEEVIAKCTEQLIKLNKKIELL